MKGVKLFHRDKANLTRTERLRDFSVGTGIGHFYVLVPAESFDDVTDDVLRSVKFAAAEHMEHPYLFFHRGAVDPVHFCKCVVKRKRPDALSVFRAQLFSPFRIFGERGERRADGAIIRGVKEGSLRTMQKITAAARVRGDHGQSACHRLHDRPRQALRFGQMYVDVGGTHERRDIGSVSEKAYV